MAGDGHRNRIRRARLSHCADRFRHADLFGDVGVAGDHGVGVTGRFQLNRTSDALSMISTLLDVDAVQTGSEISLSRKAPQDR